MGTERIVSDVSSAAQAVTGGGTTSGAAQQISVTSTKLARGVVFKADPTNAGYIAVGNASNITCRANAATDGLTLAGGDVVNIDIDDLANFWFRGSDATQNYTFFYR